MSEGKTAKRGASQRNSERRRTQPATARRVTVPESAQSPQKRRDDNTKRTSKAKKLKLFGVGLGLDMPFCLLVLVLLTIGIIMMFSASYPIAYSTYGDSFYFLKRQILFAVIGIVCMIGFSFFNYRIFYRFAKIILAISYIVLLLVLILPASNGVRRWIGVGSFTIQASEITKFCIIVFFAYWGTKYFEKMRYMKYSFIPGIIVFGSTGILLILEPHFSCTVIVFLLVLIMLYISGMEGKYFVFIGALVGLGLLFMWVTGLLGYAMDRMDGWGKALDYTTSEMWQTTWQTRNSLYAIGSGGLTGLGLGQSRQKYLYLPEPQNDFIFAIVCEELGLIGAILILVLFGLLVWRGITMSRKASDMFGKLLGIGLTAQVGLQVILNIFVITDWLPNTGISLPFFSYGGSSLIMLLSQMGVILSVSRTAKIEKR